MNTQLRTLSVLAALTSLAACGETSPVGPSSTAASFSKNGASSSSKGGNVTETKLEVHLKADAAFPVVSADAKFESKGTERQLEIEVEHLAPGTVVTFRLGGVVIGTATANSFGDAELSLRNAAAPATVARLAVLVTDAGSATIATGSF